MFGDLVFGWRTTLLFVAFVELLTIAGALLKQIRHRTANKTLAALLIVLCGMITPWMIGFAGIYDKWQWLTFAPFAISLAIAPLTYLYVYGLLHDRWPDRGWRHLVPAALQFSYLAGAFLALRQPFKNVWLAQSSVEYDIIIGGTVLISLAVYGAAARSLIARYRGLLRRQRSDDHRFALSWLERAVTALFVLLAVWAGYGAWDLVQPLGYRGLMGLYVAIAAFALFLGIEGWRHSSVKFPSLSELVLQVPPTQEWMGKVEEWIACVRDERLYADPELSVSRLARLIGTNSLCVARLQSGAGR